MAPEIAIGIGSLMVAFAALIYSMVSFNRQQRRAETYAVASVKPMLDIRSQAYTDLKSIRLSNFGIGPAIIKKAEFKRDPSGEPTNSIVELFTIDIIWETFVYIVPGRVLSAGEEMVLVRESLEHLLSQNYDRESALLILQKWQEQKSGINVRIEYEDIYGNAMPTLNTVLS